MDTVTEARGSVKDLKKSFRGVRFNSLLQTGVLRKVNGGYVCNLCFRIVGGRDEALAHVAVEHKDVWYEATKYTIWKLLKRYGALPYTLFDELGINPKVYGFKIMYVGRKRRIVVPP